MRRALKMASGSNPDVRILSYGSQSKLTLQIADDAHARPPAGNYARSCKPFLREQEDHACRAVKEGRTLTDVAAELSVTPATIYRPLKRGGQEPPGRRRKAEPPAQALTEAEEEFVRKETAQGRAAREIAEELGVNSLTVRRLLKREK